jgi:hypothetical protein
MITWDESLMAWFTSIDMAKSSSVTHIEEREDVWVALRKLNHCRGFSPSRISCSKLIQMGLADVLLPRWCRKTKGARGRGTREQNVWASVCVWRVKWSGPGLRTAGRRAVWSSESGSEGSSVGQQMIVRAGGKNDQGEEHLSPWPWLDIYRARQQQLLWTSLTEISGKSGCLIEIRND